MCLEYLADTVVFQFWRGHVISLVFILCDGGVWYRRISQVREYPKFVASIFMRCICVSDAVIILKVKNGF